MFICLMYIVVNIYNIYNVDLYIMVSEKIVGVGESVIY